MTQGEHVVGTRESKYWFLRDKAGKGDGLKFTLDKREYFTGLGSLLEVLAQMLEQCQKLQKPPTAHHIELLRALQEELNFLQDSCRIVDKE